MNQELPPEDEQAIQQQCLYKFATFGIGVRSAYVTGATDGYLLALSKMPVWVKASDGVPDKIGLEGPIFRAIESKVFFGQCDHFEKEEGYISFGIDDYGDETTLDISDAEWLDESPGAYLRSLEREKAQAARDAIRWMLDNTHGRLPADLEATVNEYFQSQNTQQR